ncbi:hypothetical protein VHEMI09423 [[Torrubiella] hemipterigena]|uniref:Uncharacterized protein n=1 Tax=[Torrubiella] hemipterigena TaxID=1531966 RepID=A0A0A1TRG3_9HYPO|nr:hypothetical protein VHEMI09423 [[Torrubiella] hemipterigena]
MSISIDTVAAKGYRRPASPDQDDIDDGDSILSTHDDVQAVMQPALSPVASRYTSLRTPAVEKAAVIKSGGPRGYFDLGIDDSPPSRSDSTPLTVRSPSQQPKTSSPAHAATWTSSGKSPESKDTRTRTTRTVLGVALGPSRNRSRSAGHEALKKLQKAFPSLNMSSNFLPSLPNALRFNDSKPSPPKSPPRSRKASDPPQAAPPTRSPPSTLLDSARLPIHDHILLPNDTITDLPPRPSTSCAPGLRPKALRRVTSDESMLYHSLSRTSSLGDDARFQDVRDMVNIRLIAIRDSLPDVPSFKMPTLPSFQELSKRSSLSLNNIFSSDPVSDSPPARDLNGHDSPPEVSDEPSDILDRVLQDLTGDIVILGGYRGSILRSAEPPHHQLWAPFKLGLNMRKANLEVGLEDEDEENMPQTIIPSGMLKNIGPIDISRKFFKKLRSCENAKAGKLRVWDFGYDWRLSPARLSQALQDFLAKLPSNQPGVSPDAKGAIVVAHSLGGLITRHAVNQRPGLFAGVLYAGVPQGCINILGPLRNGDPVLFNEKLLTAKVNFSIRTSFLLLPDTGLCFVDQNTGEDYPIDFFNPDDWVKSRLSPCVADVLPPYNKPSQTTSPLTSLFPNTFLRSRSASKSEHKTANGYAAAADTTTPDVNAVAAETTNGTSTTTADQAAPLSDPEQRRNYEYLAKTLAATKLFRSQLAHSSEHESKNAYPPLALIYGKDIPTVFAVRVQNREAIAHSDCYDDLIFRSGDGVVLAKEAMLPDGYAAVRGGRVSSERGHITLLGDFPALGKALEALLRGRRKGIGLGIDALRS